MSYLSHINRILLITYTLLATNIGFANDERITLFPIEKYDQTISHWVKPSAGDDQTLITPEMQQKRFDLFKEHYFGNLSPWNEGYVKQILMQKAPDDLKNLESLILKEFSNKDVPANKIGHGVNFRPYEDNWINDIRVNIELSQFDNLSYRYDNRAIATTNLSARILPTDEPHFFSHLIAGEGYPFDNLQVSSVWAGTPLYILLQTKDKAWSLVVTPEFIAWVHTDGIARTDANFVSQWTQAANRSLAAITKNNLPINVDNEHLFLAYMGSVFPVEKSFAGSRIMVPIKNGGKAIIGSADIDNNDLVFMPYPFTTRNITTLMQSLLGRAYGWGNMYFLNDCSAELKSLLTPFAIWLPRHSTEQVTEGKLIDMSGSTMEERLNYLKQYGRPFLTIVYIGGHVFMYLGNYPNPNNHQVVPLSFQNMWGLRPADNSRRAVIGKSVLLPILASYPEDSSLKSPAAKPYFQISYLNEFPIRTTAHQAVNLRLLMQIGS